MHLPVAVHRHPRARCPHRDVLLQQHLTRLRVRNSTRGSTLATSCRVADSLLSRGVGLLGRAGLPEGEGLRITRTASITMLFMRFAIDAVFVDRTGRVTKVAPWLRPWIPLASSPRAAEVLELPAGTIAHSGTQVGDELLFEPA